jgi:hypothetical protein
MQRQEPTTARMIQRLRHRQAGDPADAVAGKNAFDNNLWVSSPFHLQFLIMPFHQSNYMGMGWNLNRTGFSD